MGTVVRRKAYPSNLSREWKPLGVSVRGFDVEARNSNHSVNGEIQIEYRVAYEGADEYLDNMGKPSIASAEAAIRGIPRRADQIRERVDETRAGIDRMEALQKVPFGQADQLAKKKQQHKAILDDMEANPVPPPSWLRQGTPIDSAIFVNGERRIVTGHRWTPEGWFVSTEEGDVPYLDAKDELGMSLYDEVEFTPPEVKEGSRFSSGEREDGGEVPQDGEAQGRRPRGRRGRQLPALPVRRERRASPPAGGAMGEEGPVARQHLPDRRHGRPLCGQPAWIGAGPGAVHGVGAEPEIRAQVCAPQGWNGRAAERLAQPHGQDRAGVAENLRARPAGTRWG